MYRKFIDIVSTIYVNLIVNEIALSNIIFILQINEILDRNSNKMELNVIFIVS